MHVACCMLHVLDCMSLSIHNVFLVSYCVYVSNTSLLIFTPVLFI